MKLFYKKRPLIVEAEQMHEPFIVNTLEGTMTGGPGDFLVTGTHGEQYPVKKAIFEETYEEV